jgi:hypothetical protein
MGSGYVVLTKEALSATANPVDAILALREDPYHRAFAIPYARPQGKPDAGIGKAAPWKLYWKRMNVPKPVKDEGRAFFEFLRATGRPGAANLEKAVKHIIAKSREFNPKGKMRVYNGLMYNEKQIALMEAKAKGLTKK